MSSEITPTLPRPLPLGKRVYRKIKKFNSKNFTVVRNHDLISAKVSVVITLYNLEKYIESCLDSVLRNDLDGVEIVVVDDRSRDRSLERVLPYMESKSPITLIRKKVNTGLVHSRNMGIDQCIGRFIFILDADNTINTDCLSAHYHMMEEGKYWACYGRIECFDEEGNWVREISHAPFNPQALFDGNYIDAMAMFDKEQLIRIGKYDLEMIKYGIGWEDYELWLRLGNAKAPVGFIDRPLSKYLVRPDGMNILAATKYSKSLTQYLFYKYR